MNSFHIPDDIKRIKIDIGLSYSAPQSNIWLNNDKDLFVFGFEPNPECVESILAGSIKKREIFHGDPLSNENKSRFHLFPIALSDVDEPSEMDFYMTSKDCGTSSLMEPISFEIKSKITVPVFSLKHFFDLFPWERFDFIEYIKIDAQGSDLKILKSAKNYLSERVVFVTAEPENNSYVNCSDNSYQNIKSYMESQGFLEIKHHNTHDPTFVNSKFIHLAKEIFIAQI